MDPLQNKSKKMSKKTVDFFSKSKSSKN